MKAILELISLLLEGMLTLVVAVMIGYSIYGYVKRNAIYNENKDVFSKPLAIGFALILSFLSLCTMASIPAAIQTFATAGLKMGLLSIVVVGVYGIATFGFLKLILRFKHLEIDKNAFVICKDMYTAGIGSVLRGVLIFLFFYIFILLIVARMCGIFKRDI